MQMQRRSHRLISFRMKVQMIGWKKWKTLKKRKHSIRKIKASHGNGGYEILAKLYQDL